MYEYTPLGSGRNMTEQILQEFARSIQGDSTLVVCTDHGAARVLVRAMATAAEEYGLFPRFRLNHSMNEVRFDGAEGSVRFVSVQDPTKLIGWRGRVLANCYMPEPWQPVGG